MNIPLSFVVVTVSLLGLLLGSFANVIIWRLPREESIVKPRSHCTKCQKVVRWFDNVPVISWILLKGRCRYCKLKISWKYPLVESLMAVLFGLIFYYYQWSWTTLELLIFAFGLVTVSFIDFDHMILPDEFTLSGIVIGLLGSFLNPQRHFLSSLAGVFLGGGFLWAIAVIYFAMRKQEGMGGGDIKLLAWIGAVLGWESIPFVILVSSLLGSLVGMTYVFRGGAGLKASIPFGPYLALAALIYIFGGQSIGNWYLNLFLPQLLPTN
ncbi:MAG: prepilin peptidase [Bdellovibrionales bacterium]|nr:prepilin peptidase [Bdellovibrionales bacterium]